MSFFEDFNWKFYVNYYSDLQEHNINTFEKAYSHWKNFGEKEGRMCNFNWYNYIPKDIISMDKATEIWLNKNDLLSGVRSNNDVKSINDIISDVRSIIITEDTKLCLFATYYNNINEILLYAKQISTFMDYIIIISNKPVKTFGNIYNLIYTKNIGLDFGIYLRAFKALNLVTIPKELLLINDSCIVQNNFKNFFNWSKKYNNCLLGLTENYDINHHIQSYFLYFKGSVVKQCLYFMNRFDFNQLIIEKHTKDYYNDYVKKFHNIYVENGYKFYIIVKFEVGLSQYIKSFGNNIESFIKYNEKTIYNSPEYYLNILPVSKKDIIYKNKELYKKFLLTRKLNGLII
jgi:hypothetical protein